MKDRTLAGRRHWLGPGTAAFMILVGFAGCGGGASGPSEQDVAPPPQTFSDSALRAAQPGELATYFKSRLRQRANLGLAGDNGISLGLAPVASPSVAAGAVFSSAPLQEQGVDEDRFKTDGSVVFGLHPASAEGPEPAQARLTAARRQPDGRLGAVSSVSLHPGFRPQGMYLAGEPAKLVVLAQANPGAVPALHAAALAPAQRQLSMDVFTLDDPLKPSRASRIEVDGDLLGTRLIGHVLYLVSHWTPDLGRYQLPANATAAQIEESLGRLTAAELVPKVRIDGGAPQPLVSEKDCVLQPDNASLGLQLTTITAIDLSAPDRARASRCFVGGAEALYVSATHVYVASSRQYATADGAGAAVFPPNARTDIHKFALQGLQVTYRASGEVPGHLGWDPDKKPYRLSEFQGELRVLSFTGEPPRTAGPLPVLAAGQPRLASPATLTVLREDAAQRSLRPVTGLPDA